MAKFDPNRGENQHDIRFDRDRSIRIEHHSAKGHVVRNVGSFTRGTQLIRLEYMMVWQGVKVPLFLGLGTFILLLCGFMMFRMHVHVTHLVLMRLLAGFWSWCDLSPDKMVDLTLPSGDIIEVSMENLPYNESVHDAWSVFLRCFVASGIGAGVLTFPLTAWFTNLAYVRGSDILQERHERGAMLVDRDVLIAEIDAFNFEKLTDQVREKHPGFDPHKVARASIQTRLQHGFHVPYSIADVPYPFDLERTHGMLIGTTGTGKTTVLLRIIEQARERNHRCVIFDLTGVFVQHFYDPERDFILNPIDERCPPWSIFSDCHSMLEFNSAAAALFPSSSDGGDPFWTMSARTLFVEMCIKLNERKMRTNGDLIHNLLFANLKDVHAAMKGTVAAPLTSTDAARMAESIRAVVNTQAQILRYLPDVSDKHPRDFSIRKWVKEDKQDGSILFITSNHTHLNVTKPLMSLWMDLAVNSVLETERNAGMKIWFLFDEVHALQRLPALEHGLQTARAYGGAFLLGIHSFERLCETYGKEGGTNLAALARTKLILTAADRTTAEFCASQIGNREVREVDESYSIGAAMSRDAATITPRTEVKPLILPDDIMNFPSMHGVIKFPEGFPAARIKLIYKPFSLVAAPFIEKVNLTPTKVRTIPSDVDANEEEAGGRENTEQRGNELYRPLDPEHDKTVDERAPVVHVLDAREMTTADTPGPQVTAVDDPSGTSTQNEISDAMGSIMLGQVPSSLKENSAEESRQQGVTEPGDDRSRPVREDVATSEMRTGVAVVDPVKHHHDHHRVDQPDRSQSDYQYGD